MKFLYRKFRAEIFCTKALGRGKRCLEGPRSAVAPKFQRNLIPWTQETLLISTSPTNNPPHRDQGRHQCGHLEHLLNQDWSQYIGLLVGLVMIKRVSWVQGIRFLWNFGATALLGASRHLSPLPRAFVQKFSARNFLFYRNFLSCRNFVQEISVKQKNSAKQKISVKQKISAREMKRPIMEKIRSNDQKFSFPHLISETSRSR